MCSPRYLLVTQKWLAEFFSWSHSPVSLHLNLIYYYVWKGIKETSQQSHNTKKSSKTPDSGTQLLLCVQLDHSQEWFYWMPLSLSLNLDNALFFNKIFSFLKSFEAQTSKWKAFSPDDPEHLLITDRRTLHLVALGSCFQLIIYKKIIFVFLNILICC